MLNRWIQLLRAAARHIGVRRRSSFEPEKESPRTPAELGSWAERLVVKELPRRGLELLDRNVRLADGEVDIVAMSSTGLVFIEVKARRWRDGMERPEPAEAVDDRKAKRIQRAARAWMQRSNRAAQPARFDLVAIVLRDSRDAPNQGISLDWIESAFDADPEIFLF